MSIELVAERRTILGKHVQRLRREGLIPAEIYGHGIENVSIQVPVNDLQRVFSEAGETSLIGIKIENDQLVNTLIRKVQYSPVKHEVIHVDFYAVRMTDAVTVNVPIHFVGECKLLDQGGTLVTGLNNLEIQTMPDNIPHSINVDISTLVNFSHAINVSDLVVPEGITILSNRDSLIATVQPQRTAEAVETPAVDSSVAAVPTIAREEPLK